MHSNAIDELKPLQPNLFSQLYTNSIKNFINFESESSRMITQKEKFFIFFILIYCMTFTGTSISLSGLSLLEFSQNLKVPLQQMSYGSTAAAICSCFGSLLATYSLDKWNRQIQFALSYMIAAIDFMILPLLTSFPLYLINTGVNGFVSPLIMVTLSVWIMEMFESKSKTYLQILHLFFPIGQVLGPIIYAPFVDESNSTRLNDTGNNTSNSQFISSIDDLFGAANYSNLWKPFLITGVFQVSISALVIIAFFIKPYRKPSKKIGGANSEKELIKGQENLPANRNKIFAIFLICIMAGIQMLNESSASIYLPTYLQKSELKLDKKQASLCQGILSTAMTVGRVVNIFLTIKISAMTMLFINFFLVILGNSVILAIGSHSIQAVYVGVALLGYGFSNSYPMILSFVDKRITLTNRLMSIMSLSTALLMATVPIILGRFLDTNPSYVIVLNLSITSFALVAYVLLLVMDKRKLIK